MVHVDIKVCWCAEICLHQRSGTCPNGPIEVSRGAKKQKKNRFCATLRSRLPIGCHWNGMPWDGIPDPRSCDRVACCFGNNQVIDRSKRKELEKGVSLIGKSIHFELEKELRNSESL